MKIFTKVLSRGIFVIIKKLVKLPLMLTGAVAIGGILLDLSKNNWNIHAVFNKDN